MVYSYYKGIVYFCVGKTSGTLSLCLTLWNNANLFLTAFRDVELVAVEPMTNI